MEKEIDLRRLVIKAFHITEVEEGGENKVTASGKMTIEKKILKFYRNIHSFPN